jgi:hypothetical protein
MRPKNSCFAGWVITLPLAALLWSACSSGSKPAPSEPQQQPPGTSEQPPGPAQPPPGEPDEKLLPLPSFQACDSGKRMQLPAKWEATALMEDFFINTLWFSKFTYDESAGAFRFSLVDQFKAEQDYFTTSDGALYLLKGGDGMPASCELLTKTSPYTVPPRDWLSDKAVCVGQAPILKREQLWWKNPSGVGANWFWFNADNGLPFRSMYYVDAEPSTPVPIYEHFTFNYFPEFKEVAETNLKQIYELCKKSGKVAKATKEFARPTVAPVLARSAAMQKSKAAAAGATRAESLAKAWLPGVKQCASISSLPPSWPDQLQVTAFMTAVSFDPNPFPTRIFYDWTKKSQNTTLYYNPPAPTTYAQTAYLLGDTGYITISGEGGGVSMCQQVLPGPPVPDWKKVDGCECRAELEPKTTLNPSDVPVKVLWCPTDLELKQVFWTWYSDAGEPVVFMQSNSSPTAGTGLNLADYHAWGPGSVAPPHTFDLPAKCIGQQKPPDAFPKACNNCHLPVNSKAQSKL